MVNSAIGSDRAAMRSAAQIAVGVGIIWALTSLSIESIMLIRYFHQLPDNNFITKIMNDAIRLFPLAHAWLALRILAFYILLGTFVGLLSGASTAASMGWPTTRTRKIVFTCVTCLYLGLVMLFVFWKFYFHFPAAVPEYRMYEPVLSLVKRTGPVHFRVAGSVFFLVHGLLLVWRFRSIAAVRVKRAAQFWKPAIVMLAVAALFSVVKELRASPENNKGPNIILLCFDSLLPSHLHSERYPRNTSPHMDRFRSESVFFRQAFSPLARTMPSWASMLTGAYPHRHGIRWDLPSRDRRKIIAPNLLTELGKNDYYLAFMTDDSTFSYMEPSMGWDTVVQPEPGYFNFLTCYALKLNLIEMFGNNAVGELFFPLKKFNRAVSYTYLPEEMTDQIVRMLHKLKSKERFLLAVHFDVLHAPGTVPYPHYRHFENGAFEIPYRFIFGETDLSFLEAEFSESPDQRDEVEWHQTLIYDKLFRASDEQFGVIWETIQQLQLDQNSLIILCSDHGENLGVVPHHGNTLHQGDDANSIILMVRLPGGGSGALEFDDAVSNADIFPTILDYLGREIPGTVEGISLLPLMEGMAGQPGRFLFAETALNFLSLKASGYAPDHPMLGNPMRVYSLEPDGKIAVDEKFCREIMGSRDFMVRSRDHKLVAFPRLDGSLRYSLYDVKNDPENTVDIKTDDPQTYSFLVPILNDYIREQPLDPCD
ncbi:MAG: hypothetical protein C4520_17090 [Candidatus Abyssobacteria bacterium SURF_5]|uniref:Sulfatase N-terminal domain-containing protein n=1 Tax=Abyssobacteria bacterium (strain SURF_5) TaxID=2093360 RepID=A0A3A4N669_ABYX5|nr:MAG: hypothetical protein C4520_17090 [Candidatus Abyssubacteria bacterium SURF_5]